MEQENNMVISSHRDGALSISSIGGSEGFVYLYPEQVEHLREILRNMNPGGTRMTITMFCLAVACQSGAYLCLRMGWPVLAESMRFCAIAALVAWGATI